MDFDEIPEISPEIFDKIMVFKEQEKIAKIKQIGPIWGKYISEFQRDRNSNRFRTLYETMDLRFRNYIKNQ